MTVTVNEAVRSEGLKRALEDLNLPPRPRVFFRDLSAAWRRETGLRQTDLEQSLGEIAARGAVCIHEHEQDQLIEFTDSAADVLSASTDVLGWLYATWVLRRTRRRYAHEGRDTASAEVRRREADQAFNA
ncbi:MAG: hypothetical protein JJU22_01420 [Gammaproteobacteria bacterium]|jgi:hypothetical protein|nr:hypothetical protein [Gammaproteobacteria bacterium]